MEIATGGASAPLRAGLPPGPRLPAAVQTAWFLGHPRSFNDVMRRRYGDQFAVPSLNGVVVLGCTPAHARQMFTADPDTFRTFATGTLGSVLGDGSVLVTWGGPHKKLRKLLQPPFHGARMRGFARTMQQVTREHVARLVPGQPVRMHDVTTGISLDVILRTVFGVDGAAMDEGRQLLSTLLAMVSPLVLFSSQFQRDWFPPWRRLQEARRRYDAMVQRLVEARRASGEHGEDILGMLLDASWDDGEPLTVGEISDQLLTLLVAGHETTAISLAWAVHDLYQQPAALGRLRDELAPLGDDPEPEAVTRQPFLGAVCDESLRLRPIVTDVIRTLREPFDFGGYRLPAGIGVGVIIESIHSDPAIYPEPDAFRPERFLERRPGPFEFLPFGGGHRRCIGAAFSDQEARLVLGTLATRLDLEPLRRDERVRRNITMGPRYGVPARVLARR